MLGEKCVLSFSQTENTCKMDRDVCGAQSDSVGPSRADKRARVRETVEGHMLAGSGQSFAVEPIQAP